MQHYTNKKTNEVYGYESIEVAKEYNDDYKNLIEMTDEQFIDFRDNRPKGGKWTYKGWVIDDDLLAQEIEAEKKAEADAVQEERAKLMQEMQLRLLLDEQEEAKEIALKIKELEKGSLEEKQGDKDNKAE